MNRPARSESAAWPHLLLIGLTISSATMFGASLRGAIDTDQAFSAVIQLVDGRSLLASRSIWQVLLTGLPYAIGLLAFFLSHELGHLLACRAHRVRCTSPFAIPAPPPFQLGTLGAVIMIQDRIPSRRALFDIAIAGPIAGFVVSIALLSYARLDVLADPTAPLVAHAASSSWGVSWFTMLLSAKLGTVASAQLESHPAWCAGWVGLLATSMNLIPAGQLDGGHIVYALAPAWHRRVASAAAVFLIALSIAIWWRWNIATVWIGWALIVCLFGRRHAPLLDENDSLSPRRVGLAVLALLILLLCFMPHPLVIPLAD